VHNLRASAVSFASAEDAIVSLMQGLETGMSMFVLAFPIAVISAGLEALIKAITG
jgi:hypothetical protein